MSPENEADKLTRLDVTCVLILKFKLLPQATPYSMWSIYNPETGDRLNKDLTLHFLEIPKYAKKPIAEMTKMERWLAYFANQLNDKEKEELSMTDAAIQSAMKAARIFLNNTEERRRYINREMSIMDYNSDHENARAEGLAEGRAEGERNMEITIVKRMLLKHKPLNEIIDVVSWPKEKVLTFAKENNLSIPE